MEHGSQIRVLYVDHVTHLSGAEQSLFDLVVGLAGGPIEPVVVLPEDGPLATQLRAAGILVRKVKMSPRLLDTSRSTLRTRPLVALLRVFSFIAVGFRLRAIVKETKPQVIHTNTLKAHLLAIIPAKLSRTPLVWHMRDILPKGWLRGAFNLCARFATRIVVPSRAVAAAFGRNRAVYRKLRLVPNGIRVDTFEDREEGLALRAELGAEESDVVVGIVGRIAPWKGQDIFVHACAMLADRHPDAKFAVVGAPLFGDDDEFQHELASLVYQYDLDGRLMFTGWRGAQEAMAALDVLVHASVEPEPFGRTIAEAMAVGIPVVAAAGGATQEILPPNAGFIVPPGRPEILADALENLLSDDDLREQMGENGKAAAHRFFDVRRTVGAVGALYAEVVREWARSQARRRRLIRRPAARPAPAPRRHPMPMPPRPGAADRRPPMLQPETPETLRPARPQRRERIADEPVRPVRRTARIDEDDQPAAAARGFVDDEDDDDLGGRIDESFDEAPARPVRRSARIDDTERPDRPRRTPVAPGHRAVPAARPGARQAPPGPVAMPRPGMSPRQPMGPNRMPAGAPSRRIHTPAAFDGGHVIRRPRVLDDPRFAADLPAVFQSFDRPVEHDEIAARERLEPTVPVLEQDDLDGDEPMAPARPARPNAKNPNAKKKHASSKGRIPASMPPVSTGATAPVLEAEPEAVPVFRAEPPAEPGAEPGDEQSGRHAARPAQDTRAAVHEVRPMPYVVPSKPGYEVLKRVIDVIVASIVLLVGAPLWLLVAVGIKLESRGPALFKGTVWGRDRRPFTYYKFRSMRVEDVDDGHRKFIEEYVRRGIHGGLAHEGKQVFKFVGDSRITRIGRLIRKLSIDEIPQLVNVLKGDMSLVGPRPPLGYEFELYDDWAMQRLAVRPGMTGLQQTYARHSASFTEKVEMDLAYIRDRSTWLDLTILLKTIPAAFKGE